MDPIKRAVARLVPGLTDADMLQSERRDRAIVRARVGSVHRGGRGLRPRGKAPRQKTQEAIAAGMGSRASGMDREQSRALDAMTGDSLVALAARKTARLPVHGRSKRLSGSLCAGTICHLTKDLHCECPEVDTLIANPSASGQPLRHRDQVGTK